MLSRNQRSLLAVGTFCGLFGLGGGQALAGSFGLHEHSASAQGASFAGVAAGGQLSSMFWNPAIMTQFSGIQMESSYSAFLGDAHNTTGGVTYENLLNKALIPSSYASMQLRPDLWLGLSINAPFGLSVGFPSNWPGRNYAMDTALKTYNATPSLAYRVNEWLSVGVGLQIEYATAGLQSGLTLGGPGGPNLGSVYLNGRGWGVGATAGATITPGPNTTIGLGWRSAINQKINGTLSNPIAASGDVSLTLNLPDIVTGSIRQRVTDRVTLMGTVEWTNWSRIGTASVLYANGAQALSLPFQYRDGWLFSGGIEYAWLPSTTLRAGVGYEISPIDDSVRTPRIPDANRTWVSVGLTQSLLPNVKVDLAYSHLFIDNVNVNVVPGNPWYNPLLGTYTGSAKGSIDIISVGLKYQFAPTPAPSPVLIRKG